ncbi:Pheromone-processing carboxypeptidase KEX1 [Metarhizium anisopliae]|nr:Pheromone-processing carboxypeptidase KEX1 [Metarhizium anisopliae]
MAPRFSWSLATSWHALAILALWPASTLAGDKSAADYYVRELPGLPKNSPPIKMHAGHIEVTPETNGNLFFWHFQNNHIANRQRTVIWLNGGPGCSSEDGALMEVGPYRVTKDNALTLNNGTWNEFANLLFVDNPVGTGFSYVDTNSYIHGLNAMATQFITFLEKFFALFPEYQSDDLYIAGESYAGQHIPYIARAILDRNKSKSRAETWNLGGLLIGNGWISPQDQSSAYLKFSLERGLIEKGSDNAQQLQQMQRICDKEMSINPGHVDYPECESILNKILELTRVGSGDQECINMYDVRLRDSAPSCGMNWPPDLKYVGPYLRQPQVISALNLDKQRNTGWQECNWAPRRQWTFEGEVAGFWQEARNLTYVLFHNASHMVPFDYPRRSRDMLDRFMKVDISSIGGEPSDSRIDGEKGPDTSVGGAKNNTQQHEEETKQKLKEAQWLAYQRSGEVVLVIVIIAASVWGYFVWRQRRKGTAYSALQSDEAAGQSRTGLAAFHNRQSDRDLEAAAFDETTVDNIPLQESIGRGESKYSIGDDSDEEEGETTKT